MKALSIILLGLFMLVVANVLIFPYLKPTESVQQAPITNNMTSITVNSWELMDIQIPEDFESKGLDTFTTIKVEENNVSINRVFTKPNPCTHMNYNVSIINSTVSIFQEKVENNNSQAVCIQMVAHDQVEVNLTLENGTYSMYAYSWIDSNNPDFSDFIGVGTE